MEQVSFVEQASLVTFWFGMSLYMVATVLYAYHFVSKRHVFSWYATFTTGAGFLAHTAAIALHWAASGEVPIVGTFNSLSLAAWVLVLIYFVVEHIVKIKLYGIVLVPLAFVAMAIAQISLRTGAGVPLGEDALAQLDSWRVTMHVAFIMLANAGFAIGAAASGLYLFLGTQLKRHKTSSLVRRLPSLTQTQQLARRAIMLAFPVYTAGILLGIIRAIEFDLNWWFDPRVMMSGVVWAIFGSYLLLHYRRGASGRTLAWLGLVGLVAVVILAVIARTLPAGFHIFGL